MKSYRSILLLLVVLLSTSVFADGLVKYKDWGSSPQGYFMIKAEREEWAAIKTDADAEQFVNKFLASRAAGFADEVQKRTQKADQYFSVGKTPGSKTLRGKIVILLGPPAAISVASRQISGGRSGTASAYMSAGADAAGGPSGPSVADMSAAAQREGMGGKEMRDFNFTYSGKSLPMKRSADLLFTVELDLSSGKDRVVDRKQAEELEEIFQAAAGASLTTHPAP